MPRIAGVTIPDNKRVEIGLAYIFGIGPSNVKVVLAKAKVKDNPKFSELPSTKIDEIRVIVEKEFDVEGELKSSINQNIRRLKDIAAYRGIRHNAKLPVRGQRTKTNARTKRGHKITVGSGKKKSSEKT